METRIWNVLVGFDKVEDVMSVELSQQILPCSVKKTQILKYNATIN